MIFGNPMMLAKKPGGGGIEFISAIHDYDIRSTDGSQSEVVYVPSGAQVGDLLLMFVATASYSGTSSAPSLSGWTSLVWRYGAGNIGQGSYLLMSRFMQSGDYSWTVTATSSQTLYIGIQAWRGVSAVGNTRGSSTQSCRHAEVSPGNASAYFGMVVSSQGGSSPTDLSLVGEIPITTDSYLYVPGFNFKGVGGAGYSYDPIASPGFSDSFAAANRAYTDRYAVAELIP